jgi:hypothetical protein
MFDGRGDLRACARVVSVMDDVLDVLDVLLDGVTEPRLRLVSEDEARALMVLLGVLDDDVQPEEVRRAAGDLRFRLGSRLA